jgi:GNAT superfamily N-acetyltransferase
VSHSPIEVCNAELEHLDLLVPLFDAYRQFYRQPSDPARAHSFLQDRLQNRQSVIFLAFANGEPVGFTQLFPSFSSGALAPILILNDLFVKPEARRLGVGSALLDAAARHARTIGAVRLTLSTEITNIPAQSLYEKAGWKRDVVFCVYHLAL